MYEELDLNSISKSKIYPNIRHLKYYTDDYPNDSDRTYNIKIENHVNVWFYYSINFPDWIVFDYKTVEKDSVEKLDLKGQQWFRDTSEDEIIKTFWGDEKVIYLIEKDRISDGKAVMIRVYFHYLADE